MSFSLFVLCQDGAAVVTLKGEEENKFLSLNLKDSKSCLDSRTGGAHRAGTLTLQYLTVKGTVHQTLKIHQYPPPDLRVKHLVTQPGNAPEARPSHLTTADQVNKRPSPSEEAELTVDSSHLLKALEHNTAHRTYTQLQTTCLSTFTTSDPFEVMKDGELHLDEVQHVVCHVSL